jgi:hypothetical protein
MVSEITLGWAVIWALSLGLGEQSPGPLHVFYKNSGAAGGKASNNQNIQKVILFPFLSNSSLPTVLLLPLEPSLISCSLYYPMAGC